MKRASTFILCVFALALAATSQVTKLSTGGQPSPTLSGTGVPSVRYTCSANVGNLLYIQTDATNGRLWLCDLSTGAWAWDHLQTPFAVVTSANFTATAIVGFSRQSQVITVAGAVVGMGCYATMVSDPGNIQLQPSCYVTSANNVTVYLNNNSATVLTPTAVAVRFLLQ